MSGLHNDNGGSGYHFVTVSKDQDITVSCVLTL